MEKYLVFLFIFIVMACTGSRAENANQPAEWMGEWAAKWETPPDSYPEIKDASFYMNGKFVFTDDSLTVTVNGYPGCIFNADTLSHRQSWKVSNDTLFSINDPNVLGMIYQIKTFSKNKIKLQLTEDIFVTLTK